MRALIVFLFMLVFSAPAHAQGYEGLIAAPDDGKPAASHANDDAPNDYEGLIAAPPGAAQKKKTAATPAPAAPQSTPAAPQVSRRPNVPAPAAVTSSDQLKMRAILEKHRGRVQKNLEAMHPAIKPADYVPTAQRNGMLPLEETTKSLIDTMMSVAGNEQAAPQQRRANARAAYNQLLTYSDGIKGRRAIPDAVWLRMGMSQGLLNEQKEADEKSLVRLEKAISTLRPLQQSN